MGHQLRAAFTIRIGVKPIKRFVLPIAPDPLVVVVNLICGDIQNTFHAAGLPNAFQKIDRSHYIGFVCIMRVLVTVAHDRLCRQMQNDFRLRFIKSGFQCLKIADIPNHRMDIIFDPCDFKQ